MINLGKKMGDLLIKLSIIALTLGIVFVVSGVAFAASSTTDTLGILTVVRFIF
jgi:hypothetical protein